MAMEMERPKRQVAAVKKILAVAIANTAMSKTISDSAAASLAGVRPYIKGLIQRLDIRGYEIGPHYVIDYRESPASGLDAIFPDTLPASPPDAVLCMSKTVLDKVSGKSGWNTVPLAGIVSVPLNKPNVCGVDGQRQQIGHAYYDKLLAALPSLQASSPPNQRVHVLNVPGYPPSDEALRLINQGAHPVLVNSVPVATPTDANIAAAINGITAPGALLVLPVDTFFGSAAAIITAARAKSLPDFWPVTDWVRHSNSPTKSAVGGYGVPQALCGEMLADRIAFVWTNGSMPNPAFVKVDTKDDVVWAVSEAAAADAGVSTATVSGLRNL
jgi:hypothetical protein